MSWTKDNRYGTASADVKPVSTSTMRRWVNENRTKTRRSRSMIKAAA